MRFLPVVFLCLGCVGVIPIHSQSLSPQSVVNRAIEMMGGSQVCSVRRVSTLQGAHARDGKGRGKSVVITSPSSATSERPFTLKNERFKAPLGNDTTAALFTAPCIALYQSLHDESYSLTSETNDGDIAKVFINRVTDGTHQEWHFSISTGLPQSVAYIRPDVVKPMVLHHIQIRYLSFASSGGSVLVHKIDVTDGNVETVYSFGDAEVDSAQ